MCKIRQGTSSSYFPSMQMRPRAERNCMLISTVQEAIITDAISARYQLSTFACYSVHYHMSVRLYFIFFYFQSKCISNLKSIWRRQKSRGKPYHPQPLGDEAKISLAFHHSRYTHTNPGFCNPTPTSWGGGECYIRIPCFCGSTDVAATQGGREAYFRFLYLKQQEPKTQGR